MPGLALIVGRLRFLNRFFTPDTNCRLLRYDCQGWLCEAHIICQLGVDLTNPIFDDLAPLLHVFAKRGCVIYFISLLCCFIGRQWRITKMRCSFHHFIFCFIAAILHCLIFFSGYFGKRSLADCSLLLIALENTWWHRAPLASLHKLLKRFLLVDFNHLQSLLINILLVF